MTAKFSASADGTKVYLGNASENALEIDATGKTIKPVAPYAFDFSSLPFSKTQNGYMTLPNGFILQWGNGTGPGDGSALVNFPIPFPNGVLHGMACARSSVGAAGTFIVGVTGLDRTFMTVGVVTSAQAWVAGGFYWLAIGY